MLLFATEFPINHARSSADFLSAVQTWILGSPHTQMNRDDLDRLFISDESSVQKENERIDALWVSIDDEESAGIKYKKHERGLEWVTTTVFFRTCTESWVSIRVSCQSSRPAACLPEAKNPVLIRTLLQELGGGLDGMLHVENVPHRLENTDIEVAARLIRGTAGCRLPIVYVSAGFQDNYSVDSDRLAKNLGGMAHVILEPNRPFSLRLKIEVDSANVYGGTEVG